MTSLLRDGDAQLHSSGCLRLRVSGFDHGEHGARVAAFAWLRADPETPAILQSAAVSALAGVAMVLSCRHAVRRGAAEALEAVAHGDTQSSQVVGRAIGELPLPADITVGALVRRDEVIVAHDSTVIEDGDHVILFVSDKRDVIRIERLFQVGLSFL